MCKRSSKSKSAVRDGTVQPVNFITINGMTLSLGDLRKADFSSIPNPKASVNSLKETVTAILDILRGFSEGSNA